MQHQDMTVADETSGKSVSVVGDTYRIVLSGEQTNNAYAIIDMQIPPGGGPGPHAHADIQENFYVLEGEVEVKTEFQSTTATPGTMAQIPLGGVVHSFKNKTDKMARLLCVVVPAGLDAFFEEIGTPVAPDKFLPPPEMTPELQKKMEAIAEKYGQKLYPPDYLK